MRDRDNGYILAGVTVVTAMLAIVATALVAMAANELRSVAREERQVVEDLRLQGIALRVASELAIAPGRRTIILDAGAAIWSENEHRFLVSVVPETAKLDLNQASITALEAGAGDRLVAVWPDLRGEIDTLRAEGAELRLVDDILPQPGFAAPCLHERFTVFSGWNGEGIRPAAPDYNSSIGPGTRLAVTVQEMGATRAVTVVFLMLGRIDRPAEILDMRFHEALTDEARAACSIYGRSEHAA